MELHMGAPLKILMLEDSDADAEIVQRLLKKEKISCNFSLAMSKEAFIQELQNFDADVILADNSLPQFDATEALQMARQRSPHVPFIMVTGTVSEEFAATIIKKGADDYVLKDRLTRLPGAIDAAIKQRRFEKEGIQVQEKLIESEEKYRTLVEQAFDGIIIYSPEGVMLDFNQSAYTYLGYTKDEFSKLSISDFFFPEDLILKPIDFERLKVKKSTIDHRRLRRKDGSSLEMEISTKVLPNNNLMAIARDVTERKKAEEQIKKTNERFEIVAGATNDVIWDWDLITNNIWWNENFYSHFGYDKKTTAKGSSSWYDGIHPEDRERVQKYIHECINSKELHWTDEYRFLHADGTISTILDRGYIMYHDDQTPYRMVGAMLDITERKKTEEAIQLSNERYEVVAKATSDALWDFDFTSGKTFIPGTGYRDLFGYDIVNQYSTDQFWETHLHPDDRDRVLKNLDKVIADPEITQFAAEYRFLKADDTYAYVSDRFFIIREKGKPVRMLGAKQDISKRKKAEAKLKQSYKEIRELASHLQEVREEERAAMAREVHDELGQQLTGLKMDISWLNKKINSNDPVITEKIKGTLDLLDNAVRTVRKIASELRPSILDDLGLVAALEWQCDLFRKKSGINVNFKGDADEKSIPKHFGIGLFRILQESLTNIARHSQAENISVVLNVNNQELLLTIKDDGVGFVKSNIAGKKTLGLLGMKERTLMMGGSYEIESRPGKGTAVHILVPL